MCVQHFTDMISIKQTVFSCVSLLCTRLSYASLRASVLCIHGSRSSYRHLIYKHDLTLATVEGKIPSSVYKSISNSFVFYALFCTVCGLLNLNLFIKFLSLMKNLC